MTGGSVKIEGLTQIKDKLGKIPGNVRREADKMLATVANDFVNRAQADAPQDERTLANSITAEKKAEMHHEAVSPMPYSAAMEFGTKSRFKAIPGIDASKYRMDKRGDYYDFLNNILDWVKRKGIASRFSVKTRKALKHTKADDERLVETAQAIANSIIRHGVHPHPYFFKQIPLAQAQLNKLMKEVIVKVLK